MRKTLLTCLFAGIILSSKAQSVIQLPLKDSIIYYEEIVKVNQPDSIKLFNTAQAWFANTFKNSKSVLRINDRQSMQLIGKGGTLLESGSGDVASLYITYTIAIDIKSGRYRYRLYNFGFESGLNTEDASIGYSHYLHGELHKIPFEGKKGALKRYSRLYGSIGQTSNDLVASLKSSMDNSDSNTF